MAFHPDHLARDRSRSPARHRIRPPVPLFRPPVPSLQEMQLIQEKTTADTAYDAGKKRVYVTTGAGTVKRIALDLDGQDTIGTVKAKIQEKEGIPIEQQLLSLELEDRHKLKDVFGEYELELVLSEEYELVPALQLLILESSFRFILKLKFKINQVAMSNV